jgi:hypothetical protein
MINSIATTVQTVTNGNNVLFPTDRIRTKACQCACKGWLAHDTGSGLFTITKPGIYEISFDADITSATVGDASLVLEQNGEAIGGTQSLYNIATASTYGNVSGDTLIQVPCGASYTITLGNNSGLDLLVQNANIIIKKIA